MHKDVRIFISSTFLDMQEERDYIHHVTYPTLSSLCHSYGLNLYVDDLRWGAMEEDLNNSNAVRYCLREIDRCRPFFIGLVGDRYGWIPQETPIALDLGGQRYDGVSVTEIECWYGAFNRNYSDMQCGFCIRKQNDSYKSDNDIKLNALKQRIRSSSYPILESYTSPEEVGEFIIELVTKYLINNYDNTDVEYNKQVAFQEEIFNFDTATTVFDRVVDKSKGEWSIEQSYINCDLTAESYEWFEYYLCSTIRNGTTKLVLTIPNNTSRVACNQMLAKLSRVSYIDYKFIFVNPTASHNMTNWQAVAQYVISQASKLFKNAPRPSDLPSCTTDLLTREQAQELFYELSNLAENDFTEGKKLVIVLEDMDLLDRYNFGNLLLWLPTYVHPSITFICTVKNKANAAALKLQGWLVRPCTTWNNVANEHFLLSILEKSGKLFGLNSKQTELLRDLPIFKNGDLVAFLGDYFSRFVTFSTINDVIALISDSGDDLINRLCDYHLGQLEEDKRQIAVLALKILCSLTIALPEQAFISSLEHFTKISTIAYTSIFDKIAPFISSDNGSLKIRDIAIAEQLKQKLGSLSAKETLILCKALSVVEQQYPQLKVSCPAQKATLLAKANLNTELASLVSEPKTTSALFTYLPELFEQIFACLHKRNALDSNKMFEYVKKGGSSYYPLLTFLFALNERYNQGDDLEAYFDIPFFYVNTTEPYLSRMPEKVRTLNYASYTNCVRLTMIAIQEYIEQRPDQSCQDVEDYLKLCLFLE